MLRSGAPKTLDKARELIRLRLGFGGYNRNAVHRILCEGQRGQGQAGVDPLIGELDLEQAVGPAPGSDFSKVAWQPFSRAAARSPATRSPSH